MLPQISDLYTCGENISCFAATISVRNKVAKNHNSMASLKSLLQSKSTFFHMYFFTCAGLEIQNDSTQKNYTPSTSFLFLPAENIIFPDCRFGNNEFFLFK